MSILEPTTIEIRDSAKRDSAIALLDADLDHFDMVYILADKLVSDMSRHSIPLANQWPGRVRGSSQDLADRLRAVADRLDQLAADPAVRAPILALAAE
jgi:hypothetical protein